MTDLKPCPCGETPEELWITRYSDRGGHVAGSCCGAWVIRFHSKYSAESRKEFEDIARKYWNNHRRNSLENLFLLKATGPKRS